MLLIVLLVLVEMLGNMKQGVGDLPSNLFQLEGNKGNHVKTTTTTKKTH